MSGNDNYPDDIRQYDDDPRSPFFDEPTHLPCADCGEMNWADEYATDDIVCDACLEESES